MNFKFRIKYLISYEGKNCDIRYSILDLRFDGRMVSLNGSIGRRERLEKK